MSRTRKSSGDTQFCVEHRHSNIMRCPVLAVSISCALLVFSAASAAQVDQSSDSGGTSPGISPEGRDETTANPATSRGVLEVTVGEPVVTGRYPPRSNRRGDRNATQTNILLCTLEGDCMFRVVRIGGNESEIQPNGGNRIMNPVIVTDFNEDPLRGTGNGEENGRNNYNVPVIVGYRGAVQDDGFYYPGNGGGQNVDRLPPYYGMRPSPVFFQAYPALRIYEPVPQVPPRPDFSHGSYRPTNPQNFDLPCIYPDNDRRCIYPQYPPSVAARQYDPTLFPGNGPRTPSPYGNLQPTRRPDNFNSIMTPVGRSNSRPTVYRPMNRPAEPEIVSLRGRMNLDQPEEFSVLGNWPPRPNSGRDNTQLDGRLGEPLNRSNS